MLSRPFLDPRHFRIDDLLRGPYTADALFGPSGPHLSAAHPNGWGLANGFRWDNQGDFGMFTLAIAADGNPVHPAESVSRPSHLTLHGLSDDGTLQVTEDKFITDRDVAVSVLSLRNSGLYDLDVRINLTWHVPEGEQALAQTPVYVLREAPPGDDLNLHLSSQSYRVLTFLAAVARDRDAARRSAWSVFEAEEAAFPRRSAHYVLPDANPLLAHVKRYQQWFDRSVPRFDCSDPWLTKRWYASWQDARRSGKRDADFLSRIDAGSLPFDNPTALEAAVRAGFADGDFDRPLPDIGLQWPECIVRLCGLQKTASSFYVEPSPIAADWSYFCLEDVQTSVGKLTLVWDNPAVSADAYDDGDKGLRIFVSGQSVYHAPEPTGFSLPSSVLPPAT